MAPLILWDAISCWSGCTRSARILPLERSENQGQSSRFQLDWMVASLDLNDRPVGRYRAAQQASQQIALLIRHISKTWLARLQRNCRQRPQ